MTTICRSDLSASVSRDEEWIEARCAELREHDTQIVNIIDGIIEALEWEIYALQKAKKLLGGVWACSRIAMTVNAVDIAKRIEHPKIRQRAISVLEEWDGMHPGDLNDMPAEEYGSSYFHDLHQQVLDGEFDYRECAQ